MATVAELKQAACAAIDRHSAELIGVSKDILEHPEPGYSEYRTARVVAEQFAKMGIKFRPGLALTGLKGEVKGGGGSGPRVAIIGELDSLIVNGHPHAADDTSAAHACGHHCQIGMMLGAVTGLMQPEVLGELSGEIVPFAVPAEEFIEVARRLDLRTEGKIEFMGGKQELIKLGEFDDVDIAMMCHTASDMGAHRFAMGGTSNGHVVQYVRLIGRGAHAGAAPHMGINALNAATFALQAVNSNREVFREQDTVRIHGIMTKGGEAVSAVPADVRLEWRVRSGTPEAVVRNSEIVDRCFRAGALAVGASVSITNIPGYLPMRHDQNLMDVFRSNAVGLLDENKVLVMPPSRNRGGSTDMGDLSHILPSIHPYTGGAEGAGHSSEYVITDYRQAVVNPAKIMAMAVIDLLADNANKARQVTSSFRPAMTRATYLNFQRQRAEVLEYDGGNG
ncbi:MAG: amidohydrolase [Chloroflexi bacterium]|nr:amidohydrolase [Chloroflexota bacterium]